MYISTSTSGYSQLHTLPQGSVQFISGFWHQKQSLNRTVSLQHGYDMLEKSGNLDDLRLAAGLLHQSEFRGFLFMDSDTYKWLEAASLELGRQYDLRLDQLIDEIITLIGAAQQSDGYINSFYTLIQPGSRWVDLDHGHELYCAGHLIEAAIAHHRATGKQNLLQIALRFADYIDQSFGPSPDQRQAACGHPEIELALVELFRHTGEQRYLNLANFFITIRGKGTMQGYGQWGPEYHQDRVPVRDAQVVEGHAVRQLYLAAGVTDVYLETGETALLDAMQRIWEDMTTRKTYLTGGFGARHGGEAFGSPYELPSATSYCETCAAIAGIMWNWRMLLATGEARFADLLERSLYNGFLSGWSLDGTHFFYVNPLQSEGESSREEWFACACCPPNVMRTIAGLHNLVATGDDSSLQIHLFASCQIQYAGRKISIETDYPWDGTVNIQIIDTPPQNWELSIRLPAWAEHARLDLNGHPVTLDSLPGQYAHISCYWKPGDTISLHFPIAPRLTVAHPLVQELNHHAAIEYGPLVYCLEQADHPGDIDLNHLHLDPCESFTANWQPETLSGIISIKGKAYFIPPTEWDAKLYQPWQSLRVAAIPISFTSIPYYAWANRSMGKMRVWLPLVESCRHL